MNAVRTIVRVDLDALFALVEQRDEPRYQGESLSKRGAVAASYEARRYGIHSAVPSRNAH